MPTTEKGGAKCSHRTSLMLHKRCTHVHTHKKRGKPPQTHTQVKPQIMQHMRDHKCPHEKKYIYIKHNKLVPWTKKKKIIQELLAASISPPFALCTARRSAYHSPLDSVPPPKTTQSRNAPSSSTLLHQRKAEAARLLYNVLPYARNRKSGPHRASCDTRRTITCPTCSSKIKQPTRMREKKQ